MKWALSSAGSEHLVYTEGVGGSNPSAPTLKIKHLRSKFVSAFLLGNILAGSYQLSCMGSFKIWTNPKKSL